MASRKEREAEEMRRRRLAIRRFKMYVRMVMYNRSWLLDMEDEQKLSLNVQKNIAILIRPHRKIGILTLPEKTLLRTHHYLRTVKDRKRLVTLFASLTCFASFPPKVRARLVSVATFSDLQKNRCLIREGAEPLMMYFILYGEVEIYKRVFEHITETYEEKLIGLLGAGDCVGEMEFLEDLSTRHNTYLASMDTEVLVVLKEDFERILKPVMSQEWMDRKTAIQAVKFFDFFTEEQLIIACKLGMLRQFDPLETIYHEDKGLASFAYFVISGECMILQCLSIKTTYKNGKKSYSLRDVSKEKSTNIFEDLTNKEIMRILFEESHQNKMIYDMDLESETDEDERALGISLKPQKTAIVDIDTLCAKQNTQQKLLRSSDTLLGVEEFSTKSISKTESMKYEDNQFENITDSNGLVEINDSTAAVRTHDRKKINNDTSNANSNDRIDGGNEKSDDEPSNIQKVGIDSDKDDVIGKIRSEDKTDQISKKEKRSTSTTSKISTPSTSLISTETKAPTKKEDKEEESVNHFIDVGAMTFGGIFGLGEKFEHRVIMARTTVQCLLLPRFWLFDKEQNPANVWQRRRFYLDSTIPSRQTLFKNFLATLKWQKFKKDMINSIIDTKLNSNSTKVQDIPIICRITEGDDD